MLNVWLLTSTWAFFVDGEVNRKANAVRLQAVENVPAIIQTTRELITIKTTTTGNQPSSDVYWVLFSLAKPVWSN